jgi:hypothetical protein
MRSVRHVLVSVVALGLLVAGPAGAQASEAPAAGGRPGALAEAVTFAPLGIRGITFDDWAAMKAAHGLEDVTSATPITERLDAIQTLTAEEGPFGGIGLRDFVGFAEANGWDLTDLDWEADYVTDEGWVSVVRLREGFDLDPIVASYDDAGYTVEAYGDAVIRSQKRHASAAILDDGRTLVLGRSTDAVKAALDARHVQTFRAAPAAIVADALGEPLSAAIDVDARACARYDPRRVPSPDPRNLAALEAAGPLLAWEAMGISTGRTADGDPAGRIVFAYGTPADALSDMAGRTLLAQQAVSLETRRPLPESLFTLDAFTVDGNALILDVTPADGRNRRLPDALKASDLVFATCG